MGKVTNEAGAPIEGVTITGGGATTTTRADGTFTLSAPVGKNTTVRFAKAGFVANQKTVDVQDGSATAVKIKLMTEATSQALDSDQGGTVTTNTGAELTAGPGAFVDKNGDPVTGTVDVHLTAFDVGKSETLDAIPNFVATESGKEVMLQSFALIDVTVRQNGDALKIKAGETVAVKIPVASNLTDPPATMDLWSFDVTIGKWVNEGTATLSVDKKTYSATVGHLSMWNCDQAYLTTCVRGVVKVSTGQVLPGAFVTGTGIDYNGFSQATADQNGKFCLPARISSKILVTAIHPEGGGISKEVDTTADVLVLPQACASDECTDSGEYVIQLGTVTGPNGTVNCANLSLPFAGTCAAPLMTALSCFQPAGKCKTNSSGAVWDNGAKLVTNINGSMELRSSTNQLCATATVGDFTVAEITYSIPNGPSFVLLFGEDNNSDTVVRCPDGTEVKLTATDKAAFDACGGAGQSSTTCENNSTSQCSTNADCTGGSTCCKYDLGGQKIAVCVPPDSCTN